jgi:preprotein translocase subunit SecE
VSDERDSADAAGDGTDTEAAGGGQTAVVTRPQRPTGKRTRQRALSTEDDEAEDTGESGEAKADATKNGSGKKKAKTAKKSSGSGKGGRNPFVFVWTYLSQVVAELRKVIWPNRKQMVSYTSVVLVFLAFMVALIGGVDLGLAKLVLLVFG